MTVTLVCGPPCGGKTTYVRSVARPTDVVLDFDDIAREVGGSHQHAHSQRTKDAAEAVMRHRMAQVPGYDGTVYVIRCAPDGRQRAALAAYLGASVVVIDPGMAVCLARAQQRPRGTATAIRNWYSRYTPCP